jgi:hypothetical protein
MQSEQMTSVEKQALENLLQHARGDTGQSRRIADFLLAWWNPSACGACDMTTGWGLDEAIAEDMCVVFRLATRASSYHDTLSYGPQFEAVVRSWRPELIEHKES